MVDRARTWLGFGRRTERRHVDALAAKLEIPRDEAQVLLRRAREVGFGAAMLEREARADDPDS